MKTFKWIVTVLWTIIVVVVFFLAVGYSIRDKVKTGKDITYEISSNYHFVIDAPIGATLVKAESKDFFIFRKESGEVIYGVPSQPDLSWRYKTYFKAPSGPIPNGEWLVVQGMATLHLTSPKDMVVSVIMTQPENIVLVLLIVSAAIYTAGLVGLSYWKISPKPEHVEEQ